MTERDYAIRSFKEITLNAAQHTEERMDLYYEKIKTLMNNYQDLILENQMVLDELEQECQEKINENMAYALQYMDAYDYRMNLGKLKKEVNNIILIYGLCDMVNRAMTLVKYFTPNFGTEYYDVLYGCFCRHRKMTDMEIMLELGMSRASFYRKKKAALRYLGYYFLKSSCHNLQTNDISRLFRKRKSRFERAWWNLPFPSGSYIMEYSPIPLIIP